MSAKDMAKRIDVLEQRVMPHGRNVILTLDADCSPADEARGLAEAHAAAGPNGRVIVISYDKAPPPPWWTPEIVQEQQRAHAALPPRPPYELNVNDDWRGGQL